MQKEINKFIQNSLPNSPKENNKGGYTINFHLQAI